MREQNFWSDEVFLGETVNWNSRSRLETDEADLTLAGDRRQRERDVVVDSVRIRRAWKTFSILGLI